MESIDIKTSSFLLKDRILFSLLGLCILNICLGIWIDHPEIALIIPGLTLGLYSVIFYYKKLFHFLFFLIPLSVETELAGGLSTDLFGEPMLWILSVVTVILIVTRGVPQYLLSSISLIVSLHLTWIVFTSVFALYPIVSLKYALAKVWYILPFYILPFYLIQDISGIRTILKYFVSGVIVAALYYFINHLQLGLTYASRVNAGQPIWRNHVVYASVLVITIPMLWYLYKSSRHPDRWIYPMIAVLITGFMYFAFARIAYICMFTAVVYSIILRLRLTKVAIIIAVIGIVITLLWLQENNQFLHLAPNYNETITQLDFERKVSATATGSDISTMERVHRWVAGANMIKKRPITGFGPSNFYRSYQPYTIFSFETYVSDNPEHSGIHNYLLMLLVEQGYIGLSIFLILLCIVVIQVENQFHESNKKDVKKLLSMVGIILIMIVTISLVNDMIEVIKIGGAFFFMLFLVEKSRALQKI